MAKKMNMHLDDKRNEILSAGLSQEGGFAVVPSDILTKALEEAEGIDNVDPVRRSQLEIGINRPYQTARAALKGEGFTEEIYAIAGLHALRICRGDILRLAVFPFGREDSFTGVIADRLKNDMNHRDKYCALVCGSDLLALYYGDLGLVPAAGITAELGEKLDQPYLKVARGEARWLDPMPFLADDQRKRLIMLLGRCYPAKEYPGMAKYLAQYADVISDSEARRLSGLSQASDADAEVRAFIGADKLLSMTPAGYAGGLPEFFTPKLAVMQCCDAAFMGSVKEVGWRRGGGDVSVATLSFIPPLSRQLLDSGLRIMAVDFEESPDDDRFGCLIRGVNVTVTARDGNETVVRSRFYQIGEMIDLSHIPHAAQQYHMDGIDDQSWQGRILLATNYMAQSVNNLDDIGMEMPALAPLPDTFRPNGSTCEGFQIGSVMAEWVLYKTGVATRYVTVMAEDMTELVNLVTFPPKPQAGLIKCGGEGVISLDCGTTTTHAEVIVDTLNDPDSVPLEIAADDMCQPVTPMSKEQFDNICSAIMLPDIKGSLHPTAVQRFRISSSPALLNFPNGSGRLIPYGSSELARMITDKSYGRDLFINMKASDTDQNADRAAANRQAYIMAIATYIKLGSLWLLSRGQSKIRVLFAYPKGLRSTLVFTEALKMVEEESGVELKANVYPESLAAGEYVRKVRPDGLPIPEHACLVVGDLGGLSFDVDVSAGGETVMSQSYSYASMISQLSAGLALMRRPHKQALDMWGKAGPESIINSIFPGVGRVRSGDGAELAGGISQSLERVMDQNSVADMISCVYDNSNRKLLEQLYRTEKWSMPAGDSFITHWHQLWTLPIVDIIASAACYIEGSSAVIAFVGSGSLFLKGVLEADPDFDRRVWQYVADVSGKTVKAAFVASDGKPEVSRGMIEAYFKKAVYTPQAGDADSVMAARILKEAMASLQEGSAPGLEKELKCAAASGRVKLSDAKLLAGRCVAAGVNEHTYAEFVRGLSEQALIGEEQDEDECFGISSVYELLAYTPETLGGFDSFESLVSETLESFPMVADNGELNRRMMHYLVAFNIANRNLLIKQRGERGWRA